LFFGLVGTYIYRECKEMAENETVKKKIIAFVIFIFLNYIISLFILYNVTALLIEKRVEVPKSNQKVLQHK
jgi:hypothetical protein